MPSNPNKSVEKYIEQGLLILNADENARQNGDKWTLVTTIRAVLHTRLGQLRTKTIKLDELNDDISRKVDEKANLLENMRSNIKELSVYVENAFFFDDADILANLSLDRKPPADEKSFCKHAEIVITKIDSHDGNRFPLPKEIVDCMKSDIEPLRCLIDDCNNLREVRKKMVKQREKTLDDFREVLKPVRKWLWKMLPEGRADKRLHDYGFKPYGK